MMTSVALWLLGAMVIGAALLVLGLRGIRIDDHRVCRQCRFDLSGCPEGTVTCPECGAGLKRPGSVRVGQRRRVPTMAVAGVLALGLPLAVFAMTAFAMLTGQNFHRWMPLGVLLWETRFADAARQTQIASETLRRYSAKELDAGQAAASVARALHLQGDLKRPWATEWGDIIEAYRSDGRLTPDDLHRYQNQAAAALDWNVRPRVRAGDPVPIIATLREMRIGSGTVLHAMPRLTSAAIDGTPVGRAAIVDPRYGGVRKDGSIGWLQMTGQTSRFANGGVPQGHAMLALELPPGLQPGRHSLSVQLSIQTKSMIAGTITWNDPAPDDPEVRKVSGVVEFELTDGAQPGVEVVDPSESERTAMESALSPLSPRVWVYGGGSQRQYGNAQVQFNLETVPMPGAFDVFWNIDGKEHAIGSFTTGRSADPWSSVMTGPGMDRVRYVSGGVPMTASGKVDVILRPNPAAAARTLDLTRMYGAEIVYKGVDVQAQNNGMYQAPVSKPKATGSVLQRVKDWLGG